MRIRLALSAEQDLQDQWLYLAAQGSIETALAFEKRVEQVIAQLSEYPLIGIKRDELLRDVRSFPINRQCLLFYRLTTDAEGEILEIVRVACGGRDLENLF